MLNVELLPLMIEDRDALNGSFDDENGTQSTSTPSKGNTLILGQKYSYRRRVLHVVSKTSEALFVSSKDEVCGPSNCNFRDRGGLNGVAVFLN